MKKVTTEQPIDPQTLMTAILPELNGAQSPRCIDTANHRLPLDLNKLSGILSAVSSPDKLSYEECQKISESLTEFLTPINGIGGSEGVDLSLVKLADYLADTIEVFAKFNEKSLLAMEEKLIAIQNRLIQIREETKKGDGEEQNVLLTLNTLMIVGEARSVHKEHLDLLNNIREALRHLVVVKDFTEFKQLIGSLEQIEKNLSTMQASYLRDPQKMAEIVQKLTAICDQTIENFKPSRLSPLAVAGLFKKGARTAMNVLFSVVEKLFAGESLAHHKETLLKKMNLLTPFEKVEMGRTTTHKASPAA